MIRLNGFALDGLATAIKPPVAFAGWSAGLVYAAMPGWAAEVWQYKTPIAVVVLLLMMSLEMFTCYIGSTPKGKKAFPWEERILLKLMLGCIVFLALLVDIVLRVAGHAAATHGWIEYDPTQFGMLPFTLGCTVWLIGAEGIRALNNISSKTGIEDIFPPLRLVLGRFRNIDQKRWEAAGKPGPMPERWSDHLLDRLGQMEPAQMAELIKHLEENPKAELKKPSIPLDAEGAEQ